MTDKQIAGVHEAVRLPELGLTLPAKLDTGAQSASLHASQIRIVEEGGSRFVEFEWAPTKAERAHWQLEEGRAGKATFRLPLDGHVRIKTRAENREGDERSYSRRPQIELTLCIGSRRTTAVVNLADRHRFRYPLLIGSDALADLKLIVDPAVSGTLGEPACDSSRADAAAAERD